MMIMVEPSRYQYTCPEQTNGAKHLSQHCCGILVAFQWTAACPVQLTVHSVLTQTTTPCIETSSWSTLNCRPTKRKSKKADEWKYTALPKHKASKAAPEPEQQEEEGDEQQQQAASGKGKKDKQIQRSKKAAAAEAEAGAVQLEVAADREYDGPSDDDKIDEEYR